MLLPVSFKSFLLYPASHNFLAEKMMTKVIAASLSFSLYLSHSPSHTHTLVHQLAHSLSLSHSLYHTRTCSPTRTQSLSLCFSVFSDPLPLPQEASPQRRTGVIILIIFDLYPG